jgi:transposase-like protein
MNLSPKQAQVLAAIAAGQTITAAAAVAGVHRNTVANWMRESAEFREALATAQSCQRTYWREQAEQRAGAAFAVLDQILADPQAPAGVRVRAALDIIKMASTAPEPRKETGYVEFNGKEQCVADALAEMDVMVAAVEARHARGPGPQLPQNVHKFAQKPAPPPLNGNEKTP